MYYINLKNGTQHTIPADITDKQEAIDYAVSLFGRFYFPTGTASNQVTEIINEYTGENIL